MFLWRPPNSPNWYVRGIVFKGKKTTKALHKLFKLSFPVTERIVAEQLLTKLRMQEIEERLLGIPADTVRISVTDFYREYSRFCDRNKKKSTVLPDNYRLKGWLQFLERNGIESLNQISKTVLHRYIGELSGRKNSTINRHISLVRASVRWGVHQGYLSENPLRDFSRLSEGHHIRPAELDPEDMQKLLSVPDEKFRLFIQVLYWTLARKGEILSLTWGDIDLKNRIINFRETKTGNPRVIPICDPVYEAINKVASATKGVAKIFSWQPAYLTRKFQRLRDRMGLKIRGIHQFRHARASELLRAGANPRAVQELLGHKTSRTTMEIYAQVSLDGMREALNILSHSLPMKCHSEAFSGTPRHFEQSKKMLPK